MGVARLKAIAPSWVTKQLRSPLVMNGYMLVISSGLTSVLGVFYWILAARLYSEEVVGLNSAALAAMFFLTNLAQLNLVHALNRFIPSAGRGTARLVFAAYLATVVLGVVAGTVFLLGVHIWSPSLIELRSNMGYSAWFIFSIVVWCIFTLQDGVLAGLRQAKWVLLSTTSYALLKLALIVLLARGFPGQGVFFSWTAPVVFLVVPMTMFIFFKLIPKQVASSETENTFVRPAYLLRFVAGDYLGSLIWMATVNLLPVFVVERAGASAGAYFYLGWTIAYTLYFISVNMCMSFVTESARDEKRLEFYSIETLKQTLQLIVPLSVIVAVAAPFILRLYGPAYAEDGAMLLRLLSLSAIPFVFVEIRISMARIRRKIPHIFLINTALCVMVLVLSHFLLDVMGVAAVGLAWLIANSLLMAVFLATDFRVAWSKWAVQRL